MTSVGAVLVDFDGTACAHDLAEHLLERFGERGWIAYDEAVDRGEIGLRTAIVAQDRMLRADRATLLAFALEHCHMDPTFAPFCAWLADDGIPVALVSDGFGFYIETFLASVGLGDLPVITNRQRWDARGHPDGLDFVNAHPECVGCGTCKMQAVQKLSSAVRVGGVHRRRADRSLRRPLCRPRVRQGRPARVLRRGRCPYLRWESFDGIRRALQTDASLVSGRVAPVTCPGWTLPSD